MDLGMFVYLSVRACNSKTISPIGLIFFTQELLYLLWVQDADLDSRIY